MKPTPIDVLRNYEPASRLEWIESDGVGGVAASSIVGANTRKQHALLALELEPFGRCVLVSSMQETVIDGENQFDLSTNAYCRAIHPTGHRNLVGFAADPCPVWRFQFGEIELERQFFLVHGEHTAIVIYTAVKGERPLKLVARPMLAFRGQHVVRRKNDWNPVNWQVTHEFTECRPLDDFPAVYIAHPNAIVHTVPLWYYDFLYERDRESNVDCIEDLFSPGYFELELPLGQPRALVISTPSPRSINLVDRYRTEETARRLRLRKPTTGDSPLFDALVRCADLFVHETGDGGPSILAGLPWGEADYPFGLQAMPGLLLCTQRAELARDYLHGAMEEWISSRNPAAYQSAPVAGPATPLDGPLWLYPSAWHYWAATGDREFLGDELYPTLKTIAREYGERFGAKIGIDRLIVTHGSDGQDIIHLTTNALWYNAHETLAQWALALQNGQYDTWRSVSEQSRRGFLRAFGGADTGILLNAVSESEGWRDDCLRSSQALAVGLPFPVLSEAGTVLARFQAELATPVGPRSLSRRDAAYVGDGSDIRFLPRRWSGSVDPVYFGVYCDALARAGKKQVIRDLLASLETIVSDCAAGHLPGAFSGDAPHFACDLVASACAVGETLRVYTRMAKAEAK